MRGEHGGIIVGGQQVASTKQCPHCGQHFVSMAGSGIRRAWCTRCQAVTCGDLVCDACVPIEARLEHAEGTKTKYDSVIAELAAQGASLL